MILVNEIYGPTIQGEGKTTGKAVMFLRTAGCNLACVWCDTPFTWNFYGTSFEHPEKYDKLKEVHKMTVQQIIARLKELSTDTKALVISGGEPMLQQGYLIPLLEELKRDGYWIEIETNGTVTTVDRFINLIDQLNCSPKLANSGRDNPLGKRINEKELTYIASIPKTVFKFVVSSEDDIPEILALVKKFEMRQVYLMPLGKTKEEQELRMNQVMELCTKYNFNFSPRLHVLNWGNQRGV